MFDTSDYNRRQKSIRYISASALGIAIITFIVVGMGWVNDENTQTVLEFAWLCSTLVFLAGVVTGFVAWFEKKIFQYKEMLFRKDP